MICETKKLASFILGRLTIYHPRKGDQVMSLCFAWTNVTHWWGKASRNHWRCLLSWILNFIRPLNLRLPGFQFINRFYLTSLTKTVLNHLCFSSEHPMMTSKRRLLNLGVTMEMWSRASESVHFSKPSKCSCFKMSSLVNLLCLVLKCAQQSSREVVSLLLASSIAILKVCIYNKYI